MWAAMTLVLRVLQKLTPTLKEHLISPILPSKNAQPMINFQVDSETLVDHLQKNSGGSGEGMVGDRVRAAESTLQIPSARGT
jgi:hypothetical protein